MAINRWRHVSYEHDGVSRFQCLSCYHEWDASTGPCNWRFCPYCGTRWDGQHECLQHREKIWGLPRKNEYQHGSWWLIEKRHTPSYHEEGMPEPKWELEVYLDGRHRPRYVLDRLRTLRWEAERTYRDWPDDLGQKPVTEYRVSIVRSLPYWCQPWSNCVSRWYGNGHDDHLAG